MIGVDEEVGDNSIGEDLRFWAKIELELQGSLLRSRSLVGLQCPLTELTQSESNLMLEQGGTSTLTYMRRIDSLLSSVRVLVLVLLLENWDRLA